MPWNGAAATRLSQHGRPLSLIIPLFKQFKLFKLNQRPRYTWLRHERISSYSHCPAGSVRSTDRPNVRIGTALRNFG